MRWAPEWIINGLDNRPASWLTTELTDCVLERQGLPPIQAQHFIVESSTLVYLMCFFFHCLDQVFTSGRTGRTLESGVPRPNLPHHRTSWAENVGVGQIYVTAP